MTAGMLKRGTATRSSSQIAFDLESLGAMTSHSAGMDSASSSIRCAMGDFPAALSTMVDCLRNPAFDEKELEIEREAILAHLMRAEDEKSQYTYRRYLKRIFEGHGYGHSPEGDAEDVRAITAAACREWHRWVYRPEHMLFVAAGDFDPEEICGLLASHFGDWKGEGASRERYAIANPPGPPPEPLELRRPLEQGFQIVGFRTPSLADAGYPALRLASAALGEGFTGRLFKNLRDERSLAYAVGSSLRAHRLCGHLMMFIGTQPERLDEALEGLLEEARAIASAPLTEEEFHRVRNYAAGKYLMGHQSLGARVGYLSQWEDLGGGAEQDATFIERLQAVSLKEIQESVAGLLGDPVIVTLRPEAAAIPSTH
jgi:zinc protease